MVRRLGDTRKHINTQRGVRREGRLGFARPLAQRISRTWEGKPTFHYRNASSKSLIYSDVTRGNWDGSCCGILAWSSSCICSRTMLSIDTFYKRKQN